MRRERALDAVCLCGCGTAISSVNVDGKPQRFAPGGHWARYEKQRRDHQRILERIRSIPTRPML